MSEHVIVILPKPDWIQLSNVHRKILKHNGSQVYTTETIKTAKLDTLIPKVRKIHVVGHGCSSSLQGITTKDFAQALVDGGIQEGVEIRLDTCSSGGVVNSGNNISGSLLIELRNKHGLKKIIAQGTTGASITGWAGKRGVIMKRVDIVSAIQTALVIAHDKSISDAKLEYAGWLETKSSNEIKQMAKKVFDHTEQFFKDFYASIKAVENDVGQILNDPMVKDYKNSYIVNN